MSVDSYPEKDRWCQGIEGVKLLRNVVKTALGSQAVEFLTQDLTWKKNSPLAQGLGAGELDEVSTASNCPINFGTLPLNNTSRMNPA